MGDYGRLVAGLDRWFHLIDQEMLEFYRQLGYQGERLNAVDRSLREVAALRTRALPHVLPTALFLWMATLVAAGRGLASRFARRLRWPDVRAGRLAEWRLPDVAIWLLLLGLALLLSRWAGWTTSAWTLLIVPALGYCVQGMAVVQSLLIVRGIPSSIVILTLLFIVIIFPVFLPATVCVGLSDIWLDYRRLEAVANGDLS